MYILTNRDVGKGLSCRKCDERHPAIQVSHPECDKVLAALNAHHGHNADQELVIAMLVVVPNDDMEMDRADSICEEAGFHRLQKDSAPAMMVVAEFAKRRALVVRPD